MSQDPLDQNNELQGLINSGMNHLLPQALDHLEYFNNYSISKWAKIKEINDQISLFSEQGRRGFLSKEDTDRVVAYSFKLVQEVKELQEFNYTCINMFQTPVLSPNYPLPKGSPPIMHTFSSVPVLLPNDIIITKSQKKKSTRRRGRIPLNKTNLVCQKCGTSDTPEWRKGPEGPNSLCNACGLQFAKRVKREKEQVVNYTSEEMDKKIKLNTSNITSSLQTEI